MRIGFSPSGPPLHSDFSDAEVADVFAGRMKGVRKVLAMPVTVRVQQYHPLDGSVLSEFNAIASMPREKEMLSALQGSSLAFTLPIVKRIAKADFKEPLEIHDKQGRLIFRAWIDEVKF